MNIGKKENQKEINWRYFQIDSDTKTENVLLILFYH